MARYEYKVVPAPKRPTRIRGVKGDEARFAFTIEEVINTSAADGWEFLRAETLPCQHGGWFRRHVDTQTLLVFRRGKGEVVDTVPEMRGHLHTPNEPRLAAERGAPRRASFNSLRATPAHAHDTDESRG